VDVTRTDDTHANITFTSDISGGSGYKYYFVDGGSAAVNVNASSWTFTGLTKDGTGTIVGGGAGNEDGFGSFNQTFNSSDSWGDRSHVISFTLVNTGGTAWLTDSSVLTPNASGFSVAAHIGVCQLSLNPNCTTDGGAVLTGFATNGTAGHPRAGDLGHDDPGLRWHRRNDAAASLFGSRHHLNVSASNVTKGPGRKAGVSFLFRKAPRPTRGLAIATDLHCIDQSADFQP
jgi:hypothetical protein